jgi:hypothetical protein
MKNESTGRGRGGLPSWVYVASVGLALIASAAIAVRVVLVTSERAVEEADEVAALGEPSVVDEDDHSQDNELPAPSPRKGKTLLMSLSTSNSASNTSLGLPNVRSEAKPSIQEAIEQAKAEMAKCADRFRQIRDYTCTFHKHERIDGKMVNPHVMVMKARTSPHSIYFKFMEPKKGREAIFVPHKNDGKIIAHEPGMLRMIAGTMYLDPKGTMAMEENRHPISEAGIGALIDTIKTRWESELDPNETLVEIHPHTKVGARPCTMISSVHPTRQPHFLFHQVKIYIDHEHGIPIRFEGYDWPATPGADPTLLEEYTYSDLKTQVGLTDRDFDHKNPQYSYGRF